MSDSPSSGPVPHPTILPSADPTVPLDPARIAAIERIVASPSYRLASRDVEFLDREELRPVRLQLELLKPEMIQAQMGIRSTIVVFGSTRIISRQDALAGIAHLKAKARERPDDPLLEKEIAVAERLLARSHYYDAARAFARLVSASGQDGEEAEYVVVTGGGPGIMEAANRGASDVAAKSIGLNISIPTEQFPNPYITPELCFQFRYFAIRKMHFLLRARAMVAFPGGYGTMDELFEALTLVQTAKMPPIPIILFGGEYWRSIIHWESLVEEGFIAPRDLELISFAETPDEAWEIIRTFYRRDAKSGTGPSG